MENNNDKDLDRSTDELNRASEEFPNASFLEQSGSEGPSESIPEKPPSPEEYEKKKQKANPSCRKRHFVDEDPKDPSKRRRTDLMQLIARELEQRYGINWQTFLPIEVLYSEDFGELILQLYDLMDDVAKDRLDQIREKGHFEQEGYKKGSKKKGKVLKGVVNTMVGSVQREDRVIVGRPDFDQLPVDNTGQYNHINNSFITTSSADTNTSNTTRFSTIELNDQDIETISQVNQMDNDVYIGDDTDDDVNLKKNESQAKQNE